MSFARIEDRLVVCAARPSLDAAGEGQIHALLRHELDWLHVLISANRQGVIPLLEKNLAHREVPPDIATELRNWKQEIFTFNLFLSGALIKLLDLLEAHGVQVIPFKGPVLTLQAHGDLGLRQYKDLDILVRRNEVEKVCRLLRAEGFELAPDLTPAQKAASLRFGCALTFIDARNVIVDVHWRVAERHLGIELSTNQFWTRLERVNLGNRTLLTLSAEDLLLVLCCHGYAHAWDRLAWVCDLGILIERRTDLDWSYVFERARRAGVLKILLLGLSLARDLLHVTLPPEANRGLEHDEVVRTNARRMMVELFAPNDHPAKFSLLSQHLRMRERMQDKLRGFFATIVIPREYDWMFASVAAPLYYLIRPFRWATSRLRTAHESPGRVRD